VPHLGRPPLKVLDMHFSAFVAFVWLTSSFVGSARAEPFAYAGFYRQMDISALIDRYPRSSHEVSPSAEMLGLRSQDDPKEQTRRFLRARWSGTYVLRLIPEESRDHVYYVQAAMREGVTERLWLLLEKPLDPTRRRQPTRGNEARHPACSDVLKPLTVKYGKPDALAPRWEEALESFDYVWTQLPEVMKLECGRYQSRRSVFAIGVTMELAPPR
jgi:hypothetical protein